ncbi:subclass B3 metallo-beta-lactamase [Isosphaeraceae bacterium EP7]
MFKPALLIAFMLAPQSPPADSFPAHKIAGNLYYVGSRDLASYLVVTPRGHILINSGYEATVPLIADAVESLGFKLADVKILLDSHAHSDHVAGHAPLRALLAKDAQVCVMKGDEGVVSSGGEGQYYYTKMRWKPCPVDRVLADGDAVTLGGTTLVARLTAGHTRGCTSWTMRVDDGGKPLDVVIVGSTNVNPGFSLLDNADYPEIADDFARTFRTLQSFPCDIFLGAHGSYYNLNAKYQLLKTRSQANPNPFLDPAGYRAFLANGEKAYLTNLGLQKAARSFLPR